MQRIAPLLILGCLAAACAPPTTADNQNPATTPRLTAELFWQKALALLNEHNGYVTPERFEKVFGERLEPVQFHDPNMTPYTLQTPVDGYFRTRLTVFSDVYTDRIEPYTNGVHSAWGMQWGAD